MGRLDGKVALGFPLIIGQAIDPVFDGIEVLGYSARDPQTRVPRTSLPAACGEVDVVPDPWHETWDVIDDWLAVVTRRARC